MSQIRHYIAEYNQGDDEVPTHCGKRISTWGADAETITAHTNEVRGCVPCLERAVADLNASIEAGHRLQQRLADAFGLPIGLVMFPHNIRAAVLRDAHRVAPPVHAFVGGKEASPEAARRMFADVLPDKVGKAHGVPVEPARRPIACDCDGDASDIVYLVNAHGHHCENCNAFYPDRELAQAVVDMLTDTYSREDWFRSVGVIEVGASHAVMMPVGPGAPDLPAAVDGVAVNVVALDDA